MVSPGSANMVQVQSALFSYSEGKCGLEIVPLVPRSVPPQAPSADEQNINYKWSCTSNKWSIILVSAIANPALLYPLRTHKYMHTQEQNIIQVNGMQYFLAFKQQRFLVWVFWLFFPVGVTLPPGQTKMKVGRDTSYELVWRTWLCWSVHRRSLKKNWAQNRRNTVRLSVIQI